MIPFPTLPTDNLYKFTFIAGLTIVLVSFIMYFTQRQKIFSSADTLEIEILTLQHESEFLKEDYKKGYRELQKILKSDTGNKSLDTSGYFKNMEFGIAAENRFRKHVLNSSLINAKKESFNREKNDQQVLLVIVSFLLTIGTAVMVFSYRKWNERVQLPLDEKLKLELKELKHRLNREEVY